MSGALLQTTAWGMPMEPLFTNHTTMDAAACRRFLAFTWGKNAGGVRWVLLATAVLAIVYGAMQLVARGAAGVPYALGMLGVGGVAVFLSFWGWVLRAGRYVRAQQALWGGDTLDKAVRFYPGYFEQESRLGKMRFEYADVTRVREKRGALLVEMGQSAMLLCTAGFAEGDGEKFSVFMQEKIAENKTENKKK